jgi:hypothetical protein
MTRTREEILKERRRLQVEYGTLFDRVAALLFRYDPASITFEINRDEYETEARTILPRLRTCKSVEDVQRVVHEEFVRWFDEATAGPAERYGEIASEIWECGSIVGAEVANPKHPLLETARAILENYRQTIL